MQQNVPVPISLDKKTLNLLDDMAELNAEGEKPNRSREARKIIREKARELGLDTDDKKIGRKP